MSLDDWHQRMADDVPANVVGSIIIHHYGIDAGEARISELLVPSSHGNEWDVFAAIVLPNPPARKSALQVLCVSDRATTGTLP